MNPETLQTVCQVSFAIAIAVTGLAGYGSHHFGKKIERQKEVVVATKEKELNGQIAELVNGKNELVSQNKELLAKVEKYQTDLEQKDRQIDELERKAKMAARGIVSIYDYNGAKRENTAGSISLTVGPERDVFEQMVELEKARDFPNLLKVCEQQIRATPNWFTPYLFRAVAYANTGKKDEAIADLRYVIDNTLGDPKYVQAEKLLQQLEKTP